MGKLKLVVIFGAMVSLIVCGNIRAEEIRVPYPFSPETTIRSSEMNTNFQTVYDKVNELQNLVDILLENSSAPTRGLVAYYAFTGGHIGDLSGHGNDGTNNGATVTTDRHGDSERALNFLPSTYIGAAHLLMIMNGISLRVCMIMHQVI